MRPRKRHLLDRQVLGVYHAPPHSKQVRLNEGRLEFWVGLPMPGGWVCGEPDDGKPDGACGYPVESAPCPIHHPGESS